MASTTSTKIFTWSSVTSGKKQTQAEVAAAQAVIVEQARLKKDAEEAAKLAARQKQVLLKNIKLINERALLEERYKQKFEREAAETLYYTKENGFWKKIAPPGYCNTTCEAGIAAPRRYLEVPPNVSERAMNYIEEYLVNFPAEATKCRTVGEFKKAFIEAFIPYISQKYKTQLNSLDDYEHAHNLQDDCRYKTIQAWVADCDAEYKAEPSRLAPWYNPLWIFAKNVTFEKCLWAMNVVSKTFEMDTCDSTLGKPYTGFIAVEGNPASMSAKINWLQPDLTTYTGLPHNRKPFCKQKVKKQEEEYARFLLDEYI